MRMVSARGSDTSYQRDAATFREQPGNNEPGPTTAGWDAHGPHDRLNKESHNLQGRRNGTAEHNIESKMGSDTATQQLSDDFVTDDGAVDAIHVINFQLAVDDLLLAMFKDTPEKVSLRKFDDSLSNFVFAIRQIIKDLRGVRNIQLSQLIELLIPTVSAKGNNLITVCRTFDAVIMSCPDRNQYLDVLILVSEAASDLTASVIDLVQAFKINTSGKCEEREKSPTNIEEFDKLSIEINAVEERPVIFDLGHEVRKTMAQSPSPTPSSPSSSSYESIKIADDDD